jgi:hypothetical protein
MSRSIESPPGGIDRTQGPHAAEDDDVVLRAVLRLSGHLIGLVLGTLAAALIFVATNILVLKGGPIVGPHLGLLAQFFIGYRVTFAGSFIGAAYGFAAGYLTGVFIAWVYNAIVARRISTR